MKMKILVVSDPDREKNGLSEWVNRNRKYDLNFVQSDERAIDVCNRQEMHLVLVDGLNRSIDYKKLSAVVPILQPSVMITSYTGESAWKLEAKIRSLFAEKLRAGQSYVTAHTLLKTQNLLPPFSAN